MMTLRVIFATLLSLVSVPASAGSDRNPIDFDNDRMVGSFEDWSRSFDNCPTIYNPDQSDLDRDATGDACDPCPWDHEDLDTDENGIPDLCEATTVRALLGGTIVIGAWGEIPNENREL
jgi:hypothetical protein